jgi:hypothetical protein
LEDFLKSRKDWEKKLAEEAKTEKKQTEKSTKKAGVLGEFGGLLHKPIVDDFLDDDDVVNDEVSFY